MYGYNNWMKSVVKAGSKNDGGIWTDLEGRLERLNFPVGTGVYTPLFESIHNALDAIEQSDVAKGQITITVERESQLNVTEQLKKPQIVENITIADNGKGGLVFALIGALVAALSSIGIPRNSVIEYDNQYAPSNYLLVLRGNLEEVEKARSVLFSDVTKQELSKQT